MVSRSTFSQQRNEPENGPPAEGNGGSDGCVGTLVRSDGPPSDQDGVSVDRLHRLVLERRVDVLEEQLQRTERRLERTERQLERKERRLADVLERYEDVLANRDVDDDVVFSWFR